MWFHLDLPLLHALLGNVEVIPRFVAWVSGRRTRRLSEKTCNMHRVSVWNVSLAASVLCGLRSIVWELIIHTHGSTPQCCRIFSLPRITSGVVPWPALWLHLSFILLLVKATIFCYYMNRAEVSFRISDDGGVESVADVAAG